MKNQRTRKNLTSKEVARILGASEASIKRWADRGLLPSEKTAGGHRRFRPQDVAVFQRGKIHHIESSVGGSPLILSSEHGHTETVAAAARRPGMSDEALAESLFDALVGGQAEEVSALLVNSYLHGRGIAFIFDRQLAAAMRKIGDLWHQGSLTVTQEHLATRAAIRALQTLSSVIEPHEARHSLALCCGVEDDFHELPVHCTELLLKHDGWEVISLGPHTPFYVLTELVLLLNPQLICVASTILSHLDRAVREYKELREAADRVGAVIVLGGAGFAHIDVRRRLNAELYADNFQQLLDFAISLTDTNADTIADIVGG
ncbi:MAG: B12-binding domain-containing protein [Pyrinomonadaceae bacterium]